MKLISKNEITLTFKDKKPGLLNIPLINIRKTMIKHYKALFLT